MSLNKDGLEPGQAVDFETLQRIERSRGKPRQEEAREPKPQKAKPGKGGEE